MFDVVLKNTRIVDGTGAPAVKGDLGIRCGRIAALGPRITEGAGRIIDVDGETAAPGFIDIHRHADAAVFRPGAKRCWVSLPR
jgi:N-acyl-D-aspartate/D-glutamate deacylase